ncbi:MAG: hypothetical protein U9M94_03700 [Patescibacteria group bacterium]|nr:hypothetical protein [Patescibacteria group bacterium]
MKNTKKGKVYILKSTRKNGESKLYTGQTKRSVFKRFGEHINEVKKSNSKTYTGRGKRVELLGSIFSNNRFKAEKTIKKMSPSAKQRLAKSGARKYKSSRRKTKSWF